MTYLLYSSYWLLQQLIALVPIAKVFILHTFCPVGYHLLQNESRQTLVGDIAHTVITTGVLFGKKIKINGVSKCDVTHAENVSTTPERLAINLLTILFTHEELSSGNCTKATRSDIKVLDPLKIQAIRGM